MRATNRGGHALPERSGKRHSQQSQSQTLTKELVGNASSIRPRAPSHRPPSLRRGRPLARRTIASILSIIIMPPPSKVPQRKDSQAWVVFMQRAPSHYQPILQDISTYPTLRRRPQGLLLLTLGETGESFRFQGGRVRNDKHEGSKRTAATGPISWPPGSCPSCPPSHALSRPPSGQAWNKSMPTGLGAGLPITSPMIYAAAREISLPS